MALLRRLATATALLAILGASVVRAGTVGVGDVVPDFTLTDWHGRPSAIGARRGRVVLLDFWASWCTTCRLALPGLDGVARRHPGVEVIAVSIDASRATADRFLAERLPATVMTLLHDPDGDVFTRFGPGGMPSLYLIDRDGVVRLVEAGYAPPKLADVERQLERLAAGANP